MNLWTPHVSRTVGYAHSGCFSNQTVPRKARVAGTHHNKRAGQEALWGPTVSTLGLSVTHRSPALFHTGSPELDYQFGEKETGKLWCRVAAVWPAGCPPALCARRCHTKACGPVSPALPASSSSSASLPTGCHSGWGAPSKGSEKGCTGSRAAGPFWGQQATTCSGCYSKDPWKSPIEALPGLGLGRLCPPWFTGRNHGLEGVW